MVWAILIPLLVIGLAVGLIPVVYGMTHDHRSRRRGSGRYLHRFVQPRRMPEARAAGTAASPAAQAGSQAGRSTADEAVVLPATTSAAAAKAAMRDDGVSEVLVEGLDGVLGVATERDVDAVAEGRSSHEVAIGRAHRPSGSDSAS